MNQSQHEMVLEMNHASGMQGWYCPKCGRRILLLVPPSREMVIVEPGDRYASHSGSIGGLCIRAVKVKEGDGKFEGVTEESLRPWIEAIENLDLNF